MFSFPIRPQHAGKTTARQEYRTHEIIVVDMKIFINELESTRWLECEVDLMNEIPRLRDPPLSTMFIEYGMSLSWNVC